MNEIPIKTIERLSLYRRLLNMMREMGQEFVFSHQLAHLGKRTPAQVRRDLMVIGYSGSTRRGYEINQLIERIRAILDDPQGQKIAMAGVGHLGRAILTYFMPVFRTGRVEQQRHACDRCQQDEFYCHLTILFSPISVGPGLP